MKTETITRAELPLYIGSKDVQKIALVSKVSEVTVTDFVRGKTPAFECLGVGDGVRSPEQTKCKRRGEKIN